MIRDIEVLRHVQTDEEIACLLAQARMDNSGPIGRLIAGEQLYFHSARLQRAREDLFVAEYCLRLEELKNGPTIAIV